LPPEFVFDSALLSDLLAIPQIIGIKVSTSDETLIDDLSKAARTRADFAYICGNEHKTLSFLPRGAVGVIGQGTTLYPLLIKRCMEFYRACRMDLARQAQGGVEECCAAFSGMDSAVAGKMWIRSKGVNMSPHKRPSEKLPDLGEVLRRAAIIEHWLDWAGNNAAQ